MYTGYTAWVEKVSCTTLKIDLQINYTHGRRHPVHAVYFKNIQIKPNAIQVYEMIYNLKMGLYRAKRILACSSNKIVYS